MHIARAEACRAKAEACREGARPASASAHMKNYSIKGGEQMISANTKSRRVARHRRVDILGRHLLWKGETQPVEELLDQARELAGPPWYRKPLILSTDGAGHVWPKAIKALQGVLSTDGRQHLELYDSAFNNTVGMTGAATKPEHYERPVRRRMQQVGREATVLAPGGRLSRQNHYLLWNGEPIVLMGWSFYGFLSTVRHDLDVFFQALSSTSVNFTRVWVFEQWTGMGMGKSSQGSPLWESGLCPFAGRCSSAFGGEPYDLTTWNDAWFERLARFVQLADQHGVVVQLSLFDRAGLRIARGRRPTGRGHWKDSPFNAANNKQGLLVPTPADREYPRRFTGQDGTAVGAITESLVRKIIRTIRDLPDGDRLVGNVIFELANEFYPGRAFIDMAGWSRWLEEIITSELA